MMTRETPMLRLRVLPGPRGGWRVEGSTCVQSVCSTPGEAEALADQLAEEAGGGEVALYDAYLRLRTVKRLASHTRLAHG